MSPTYSARSAAIRAARSALGADRMVGVHFMIAETVDGRFAWAPINVATGEVGFPVGGGNEPDFTPDDIGEVVADHEIRAEHVPGTANHFRLNEAGQKAVAEARAKKPRTPQVPPLPGFSPLGVAAPAEKATTDILPEEASGRALARAEGREREEEVAGRFGVSRLSGKLKEAYDAARKGELPAQPDFSADTHKRWRPKLAEVVVLAEGGDLAGLRAYEIKPVSTSPKAIDRYRNLAVIALEARVAAQKEGRRA